MKSFMCLVTFIPTAIAVFSLISSPNLKEPFLLSFTKMSGTFLEAANAGRCFVSHLGLQSDANNIAYIHMSNIHEYISIYMCVCIFVQLQKVEYDTEVCEVIKVKNSFVKWILTQEKINETNHRRKSQTAGGPSQLASWSNIDRKRVGRWATSLKYLR